VFAPGQSRGGRTAHRPRDEGPYLIGLTFETQIVERPQLREVHSVARTRVSIVIFISLCGVRGCYLRARTEISAVLQSWTAGRDMIPLPEISIESDTQDIVSSLQPVFNQIWNAFGFMASSNFDEYGKWIGRRSNSTLTHGAAPKATIK